MINSVIAVSVTILLGLLYSWTSRINGIYFFGRTGDAKLRGSEAGRAITRRYLLGVALTTVVAAVIAWAGGHVAARSLGAAVLLQVVGLWFVFARANGEVRRLTQGQVSTGAPREVIQVALLEQPTYWIPGLGAILLPLAVCGAATGAAVLLAAHGAGLNAGWTALGDSMDGQGYSGMLGLATGMLAAAVGFLAVFRTSARLRTKMAQYTVRAMISLGWIATVLLVTLLACNYYAVAISRAVGKGVIFAAMVGSLAVALWNQSRHKRFVPPPVEAGGDDRWRWGLFYVDRADPALFVQSRCGAGYTLNYGRVAAWPISLGLLAYVVGVLFFLPHLK
jgi:hypothetical protein